MSGSVTVVQPAGENAAHGGICYKPVLLLVLAWSNPSG
jgi:hypothetical protein